MSKACDLAKPMMRDIIRDAIETAHQAEYDFCGDQREFHLPRVRRIMLGLAQWFPGDFAEALNDAKDAYGERLAKQLTPHQGARGT